MTPVIAAESRLRNEVQVHRSMSTGPEPLADDIETVLDEIERLRRQVMCRGCTLALIRGDDE